jgi:ribose transport system ATP-binding protein
MATTNAMPCTELPAIEFADVSKRFGAVQALDRVNLTIGVGEVLGLVGQNGAGKSTLVNILCGVVKPDHGTLRMHGDLAPVGNPRSMADRGVAVVSQEQALVSQLSVWENIYLGTELSSRSWLLRRRDMAAGAEDLLERLGIEIDAKTSLGDLSFAARQLIEIARAIHKTEGKVRPVLVLDEPTSGLSPRETDTLFSLIERNAGQSTFLFVSHVLPDILRLCSRVAVFTNGRLVADRATSGVQESDLHQLMVGKARSGDYYAERRQGSVKADESLLEMDAGSRLGSFSDVNLKVRKGEVIGLVGVVGSGISEIAAALAGVLPLNGGKLKVNGEVPRRWSVRAAIEQGVRYVPPERRIDSLFPYTTVAGNISIACLDEIRRRGTPFLNRKHESLLVADLIDKVSLRPPDPDRLIGELSGGNQQKAVFARTITGKCVVAVLDNPTRGVDVGTREEIYLMIRELASTGVGLVVTSESIEELIGLSDRLVVFAKGSVVAELPCPQGAKPGEKDVLLWM